MVNIVIRQLEWVDWLILGGIFLGFIYGVVKGFMREIAEILETAGLIYSIFEFYPRIADFLKPSAGPTLGPFVGILSFVASAAVFAFVISLADSFLRPILKTTLILPLRLLGGALLGAVHGLLLVGLLLHALTLVPVPQIQSKLSAGNSLFGLRAMQIIPQIHDRVGRAVTFFRQGR